MEVGNVSKENQIQSELQAIDGGTFQKLCDAYLRQNPRYADLKSIGSVPGKNKTTAGIPDSLITLPDGTFALAHYTTTQKPKLLGKLKGDLESSFDAGNTDVPVDQIKEVILCYNGDLGKKDELSLIEQGKARGITVTLRDLGKIAADLVDKYPRIAKDILNVEVDTGQIVWPHDFVALYNRTSPSTRLDTTFHFRDKELDAALESLRTNDIVLITGVAGVGKSRLMLEVAYRFSREEPSFEVRSIFNRGPDIFADLQCYFRAPGSYLILVDDANRRLSSFVYVLDLLRHRGEKQVKILATVRDYARESVANEASKYGIATEIFLEPFSDEEIRELISQEVRVNEPNFQKRICDLAQGNPRLAMMAADVAVRTNSLGSLSDVTALYDEYFRSVRDELAELGGKGAIKVAGIISFLRVVDRSNERQMEMTCRAFGVSSSEFWMTVERLHRIEMVDLYENEVVKFGDQLRATYLFYLAVFRERLIDFPVLLEFFFSGYKSHFMDALIPVVSSQGARIEDQIRPHIVRKWREFQDADHQDALHELILAFWWVAQTETLQFIRHEIQAFTKEAVDPEQLDFLKQQETRDTHFPLVRLLGRFRYPEFLIALELALDVFAKAPKTVGGTVLRILIEDFGFRLNSYSNGYYYQRTIIEQLWLRAGGGNSLLFSKLYLAVARHYLNVEHRVDEMKDRLTLSLTTFRLPPAPDLYEFRRSILRSVSQLFSIPALGPDVLRFISSYCHAGYQIKGKEIIQEDAQEVLPFISGLDPNVYDHVDVAQSYFCLLRREGVEYDQNLEGRFTNELSELADMFLVDRHLRRGGSWQESENWQDKKIKEYLAGAAPEKYENLFRQCLSIFPKAHGPGSGLVSRGLEKVVSVLLESDPATFVAVVDSYLEMGNPFLMTDRRLICRLIDLCGVDETHRFLCGKNFDSKARWLMLFYEVLPQEQVREEHLEDLARLYASAPSDEIYLDLQALEPYLRFDSGFILRIVQLLFTRAGNEPNSGLAFKLSLALQRHDLTAEKAALYFGKEGIDIIKRIYLTSEEEQDYLDYSGRVFELILELDSAFLCEYFDVVIARMRRKGKTWMSRYDHKREYDFLWRRDDYKLRIREMLLHLFNLEKTGIIHLHDYLAGIFAFKVNGDLPSSQIIERRMELLKELVVERASDPTFVRFILAGVNELSPEELRSLVALFLEHNQRFEDFRQLPFEPEVGAAFGSAVPMFHARKEFLESLLPLVLSVKLLDHRLFLEGKIEGYRKAIEAEKRRNFMSD